MQNMILIGVGFGILFNTLVYAAPTTKARPTLPPPAQPPVTTQTVEATTTTTPSPIEKDAVTDNSEATTAEKKPFGFAGGFAYGFELPVGEPTGVEDVLVDPLMGGEGTIGARIHDIALLTLNAGLFGGTIVYEKATGQKTWFTQTGSLGLGARVFPPLPLPVSVTAAYYFNDTITISKKFLPTQDDDLKNSSIYLGTGWAIGAGYDIIQSDPVRIGADVGWRSHTYTKTRIRNAKDELETVDLTEKVGFKSFTVMGRFLVVL